MQLTELIQQGKKRHAALMRLQKPYRKMWSLLSFVLLTYNFFKNGGEFSFTLFGLAVLALFLLYYATSISGIRFFARRSLALVIDLALVSFVLFALVSQYQRWLEPTEDILQTRLSNTLMLALWLAFFYFVIFDWRFYGTLGKRFLGLKVTNAERRRISFCRSFIRTFLSLPLPVISATLLGHWIMGYWQPGHTPSMVRLFLGEALKNALIASVPLSILFFEGNQSIADRLTHTVVRAEYEPTALLPTITSKTWALLCLSNLAWAFLLTSLFYVSLFRPWSQGPSKPLPPGVEGYEWLINDPQTTAVLWAYLPRGLKESTFGIRTIELLEISPNPFTFDPKESHFLPPLNPQPYLKETTKVPVVRVTLAHDHPLQVKMFIVENFLTFFRPKTAIARSASFSILQIATDRAFGLFSIEEHENILVAWATSSNGEPLNFYCDVQPSGREGVNLSIDKTGFLLTGAGIPVAIGSSF